MAKKATTKNKKQSTDHYQDLDLAAALLTIKQFQAACDSIESHILSLQEMGDEFVRVRGTKTLKRDVYNRFDNLAKYLLQCLERRKHERELQKLKEDRETTR